MASAPEVPLPRLVDLRQLPLPQLEELLQEETLAWRQNLHWDFQSSADLVRRFIRMHALQGFALLIDERLAGYSYYVCEDHKGLIGDLYVRQDYATPEAELQLLDATVQAILRMPLVRRIECQLLMLRHSSTMVLPRPWGAQRFPRQFMGVALSRIASLPQAHFKSTLAFEPWADRRFEQAAQFIAEAYLGHVDSIINDQYRSTPGARRFLLNITQYPGCGVFDPATSLVAVDRSENKVVGMLLSSSVASDVGHITQVCISPNARGQGIGYELIRRSLLKMADTGRNEVTLTVTSANAHAVRLYERIGFRTLRAFQAFVWDQPRG